MADKKTLILLIDDIYNLAVRGVDLTSEDIEGARKAWLTEMADTMMISARSDSNPDRIRHMIDMGLTSAYREGALVSIYSQEVDVLVENGHDEDVAKQLAAKTVKEVEKRLG